jgi:hypothetical protein
MGYRSESGHAHRRVPRYRSSCLHKREKEKGQCRCGIPLSEWFENGRAWVLTAPRGVIRGLAAPQGDLGHTDSL